MKRSFIALSAALASSACSASNDPGAAQTVAKPEAATPTPTTSLPDNAPNTPLKNVPATTGRANLTETKPPFATATMGQFDTPFAMAFLPDGALLVTEKAGMLKLRSPDGKVIDIGGIPTVAQGGQGGLLDVAVAPDFARSRVIYLSYAEPGPGGSQLALARGMLAADTAQLQGVDVIWRSGSSGQGGQFGAIITFAPDGRSLFLASGERQRFTPAQDPEQALGKILHLTLDGKAWSGNPDYQTGGVRAQTWTTGHRNPYGLVFAADGRLWEHEMGPKGGDELNLIEPGKNYGWPVVSNGDNYDGTPIPDHPSDPKYQPPILWWNPSISPSGMIIYSGDMFPAYRGSALLGALSGQALVRVTLNGTDAKPADQWDMGARIRDIAEAGDGAIWLLEDGGRLLRLTPRGQ